MADAGQYPDVELSPKTVAGLQADGLTPAESATQKLSIADVESAQRIVAFCELPEEYRTKAVIEQWDGVPPVSDGYEKARDSIVENANRLINSL